MKKKNFIAGFSAGFAALMALISCGGIRAKDGVVLTINGKSYTAQELFDDQKTPAAAEAKFNAVYKVAIRRYFEEGNDGHQYMSEITRETKNKISGSKAEAQSNASKNGTSYDTEWNKILKSNNVDDEDGLYNKYEYDLEKAKFEEKLYDYEFSEVDKGKTNYDILRNGGFLRDEKGNEIKGELATKHPLVGYLNKKQPYHMKHILVKVGAKENDELYGEITADQAIKIYNIVHELVIGTSFENVSNMYGEDDKTAQDNHASLGIMSRDTSFVNDFKLGVYLYEAAFGSSTQTDTTQSDTGYKSKKAEKELFGERDTTTGKFKDNSAGAFYDKMLEEIKDPTSNKTIGKIPYGIIEQFRPVANGGIGNMDFDNAETKERFKGIDTSKIKAKFLPRNVLFNKYFNKHNIMVITPDNAPDITPTNYYKDVGTDGTERTSNVDIFSGSEKPSYLDENGFKKFSGGDNKKSKNEDVIKFDGTNAKTVLRDNKGRVVLVFRSGTGSSKTSNADSGYQGIHFVVIERSPFIGREYDDIDQNPVNKMDTSLPEYYTQYYTSQPDGHHPKYSNGDYKYTFTNYVKGQTDAKLKARADTVKSELKKADDNLNLYVYDYLLKKGAIQFTQKGQEVKDEIDNWRENTKIGATEFEQTKKWDETWKEYYYSLESKQENRAHESGKISRLLPEACEILFKTANNATLKLLFGEKGAFYEK